MDRSDKCGCGGICYWLAGIFVLIIFILIACSTNIIASADSSPGLAGWFQALGSIAAIIATWILATRQRASDKNNELRRTVLEAVTMFYEIKTAMSLLERLYKTVDYAICYPGKTSKNSLNIYTTQINSINLRSLKEQSVLANVGFNYIESAGDIINDLSAIKNFLNLNFILYLEDNETITFNRLKSIYGDVALLYGKCFESAEILRDYAGRNGIDLPKLDRKILTSE